MKMTLNTETINRFMSLNDNTLNELIDHFLQTMPSKLRKMLESYYLKDFPAVKKEAHEIYTSSIILGADVLAQLAVEIEQAKDDPELDEYLHQRVIKAHKEFELIKTELKKFTNQLS